MGKMPQRWRTHHGRDPEKELRRLRGRFAAVSRRYHRTTKLRRFYRRARVLALAGIGGVVVWVALEAASPWPPFTTLKHIAASPNCAAARAVGLAPANRGEPGYRPRHDADNDGVACEPWPP